MQTQCISVHNARLPSYRNWIRALPYYGPSRFFRCLTTRFLCNNKRKKKCLLCGEKKMTLLDWRLPLFFSVLQSNIRPLQATLTTNAPSPGYTHQVDHSVRPISLKINRSMNQQLFSFSTVWSIVSGFVFLPWADSDGLEREEEKKGEKLCSTLSIFSCSSTTQPRAIIQGLENTNSVMPCVAMRENP